MNRLELLLHGEVGNFREFQERALVALKRHHEDGRSVSVGFRNGGRVTVVRQFALRTRHLVTHVIRRRFKVDGKFKFYGDAAHPLLTDTCQRADAGNTVDVLLKGFCDLVFNNFRIRTWIRTGYRNNRIVHRREFAHPQSEVAHDTKEQNDEREHRGKHRAAYAEFGDIHVYK